MTWINPATSFLGRGRSTNATRARLRALLISSFATVLAVGIAAQSPPAKPAAPRPAAAKPAPSCVDNVIELVTAKVSEARIINSLKSEGTACKLSTADLLKLQKAGVSEAIIDAMSTPAAAGAAAPAAAVRSAAPVAEAAGGVTPFPPDLADVSAVKKRRLTVDPFDYSTVTNWVNYWFNNNVNIGEGIRAMLTVRMAQSKNITLLERKKINNVMKEQDFGGSNRVKKGTNARIGQITGADAMLYGDIVIFGRDDTSKRKGLGAAIGRFSPIAGAVVTMKKDEKAVVGINLRIVDAETGEVIETAEARGESSRSSTDVGAVLGVKGVVIGGASDMTSSNFQQTIIGEATSAAVTNIVNFLEGKVSQFPNKARQIEGRIAALTSAGALLNVGGDDSVQRGDRFEILKINGEIKDPTTKEVIDIDAVKIGELVVDSVRDKTASGAYGGQPLASAYIGISGKGYAARLISK